MKITLVHPYPDISALGLRVLSQCLRNDGHDVVFVNLPDFAGDGQVDLQINADQRYSRKVLDDLCELAAGSGMICTSLMTNYFQSGVEISQAIRREHPDMFQVWGGIHPTIRPAECLDHADVVISGEGEDPIVELARRVANKGSWEDIPSLVFRKDGEMVRNPMPPLEQDLDRYPFPDFVLKGHHILWEDKIRPMNEDLLRRYLQNGTISRMFKKIGYQTMTSRGCPYRCTYCINSTLWDMYKGQKFVRFRSVENVVREIEEVAQRFSFVNYLWFSDDVFFARKLEDIQLFSQEYKKRVGLPFFILASPTSITDEKYKALVECGLHTVQMGIESGSKQTQTLFKRTSMNNERIIKAAEIIAKYTDRTAPPQYDFIYDIPWETDEDRRETLRLISDLPKPFRLQAFSLILYPETGIYQQAVKDNLIVDEKAEIYNRSFGRREDKYFNTLLFLSQSGKFPSKLMKVLIDERVSSALTSKPMEPVGKVTKKALAFTRKYIRNSNFKRQRILEGREATA